MLALALPTCLGHAAEPPAAPRPDGFVIAREPLHAGTAVQARMREHIRAFDAGRLAGLPAMERLTHADGRRFYRVQSPCCDHFHPLYDSTGRYVCAPSGGFTGHGDGRCPAWVATLRAQPRPAEAPAAQTSARAD